MDQAMAGAAEGLDRVMLALLPVAIAIACVAIWRLRRMGAAIRQLRAQVQAMTGDRARMQATSAADRKALQPAAAGSHRTLQIVQPADCAGLARDILDLSAAIERRTSEAARRARDQDLAHAQRVADQALRAAEAAHAQQLQAQQQRLRQLQLERDAEARQYELQCEHQRAQAQQHQELLLRKEKERTTRDRQRRALAEEFEWQVAAILEQVQGSVRELRSTSAQLTRFAADSARRSNEAAGMARRTDETAAQVAQATSGLSESAKRMRGQAQLSRDGARTAVAEAANAATAITALFEATRQIGNIAGIISEITRQTTLLSINARIEAARAGEAGRGFAVVASEVMELAARTRRATDSIDEHIQQVTGAAQHSADVLARLGQRIGELGDAAGQILDTAEVQCRSTLDISERMASINDSTRAVSASIEAAQGTAGEAQQRATTVLDAAGRMDEQTRRMQEQVARFVLDIQDGGAPAAPATLPASAGSAPYEIFSRAAAG